MAEKDNVNEEQLGEVARLRAEHEKVMKANESKPFEGSKTEL